jgi:transposase-like protein
MSYKREERKAKKYVREELARLEQVSTEPVEKRIEEAETEFNNLMEITKHDLDKVEREKNYLGKYPVAKQRLVSLYVSGHYTVSQMARILKVNNSTIQRWLRNEDVMEMIHQYQKEEDIIIGNSLRALRMKAMDTLRELTDSQNDLVALNAAKDILDRTGHGATQKQEVNVNVSYEERLKDLINGVDFEVIDADVKEVE